MRPFSATFAERPIMALIKSFSYSLATCDYVLIDVPPLGSVIDAAVVAAKCDGTILVISDNQVRYRQAIEVIEQLRKSGSKILGVVRNNIKKKDGSYYKKYYKNRYQ